VDWPVKYWLSIVNQSSFPKTEPNALHLGSCQDLYRNILQAGGPESVRHQVEGLPGAELFYGRTKTFITGYVKITIHLPDLQKAGGLGNT
jgi:hypothetical protein